jgi:hypothetical protein
MGFNADKFQNTKMAARTEKVECRALRDFFDEVPAIDAALAAGTITPEEHRKQLDAVLVWEVRGLTTSEMARCADAESRNKTVTSMLEMVGDVAGQVAALREAIGLTKGTPGEVAKRIEMLVAGSVNPKCDLQTAVLVAERFAIDFTYITNRITILTGQGFDIVKPAAASQAITV